VLKRLRWDPRIDIADFTIGYLERFEGIKEIPLQDWISETSEEDFIPQHRIRYFKLNSDQEIVCHRVFGSGLTRIAPNSIDH
jgi:uncharacterized protein (UPF0248 family)